MIVTRLVLLTTLSTPLLFGLARVAGWIRDDPPSVGVARPEVYWKQLHDEFRAYPNRDRVPLLFLGDSITHGWDNNATWRRYYAPRGAAHFGIGGDRTQHLLWRVENGELAGMNPKVIVVLIGTNNVGSDPPGQIAAGIRRVVEAIRKACPSSRVLLVGVLPRGRYGTASSPRAPLDPRPAEINAGLQGIDDGKQVRYLDIGASFLKDGEPSKALMPDFLHLSGDGYRAWAEAMEPTLAEMLEDQK